LVLPMLKLKPLERPPPGAGLLTLTVALPAAATFAAATAAVSLVALTYVVGSDVPFHLTADAASKALPLTVKVNPALPAVALAGAIALTAGSGLTLVIEKVWSPEDPPPGAGLLTVTLALPAAAISAAGTAAVSFVTLEKVVASGFPFQFTTDPETKLLPLTVKVNSAVPAVAEAGDSDVSAGAGFVLTIVKADTADVPPPGAGLLTATLALPAAAMYDAAMTAVSFVSLTNVVGNALPFHLTTDEVVKLLPLTARVNAPLPAVPLVGESDVRAGRGLVRLMSNVALLETPPPGAGLTAVTLALPALAISAAGTVTLSCVPLTYVVANAAPFQFTVVTGMNPLP